MLFRTFLLIVLFGSRGLAQARDTTPRAPVAPIAAVTGVVHDSVGRAPLAGATVQLVGDSRADFVRTVHSDSLGRFTLGAVAAGSYKLGFFHPMLDSLGVEAPLRRVRVDGQRPVRADLAIPAPARIRAAICGPQPADDSSSVLIGVVRDGRAGEPAAGVSVKGEWLEFSFSANGVVRRIASLVAVTAENGWFAMCRIPSGGTLELTAIRGADSTDAIEVQLSPDGFVRRDLYLGPTRMAVVAPAPSAGDTATRAAAVVPPRRRLPSGDSRLSGTVFGAASGRPLQGALVSITAGPETRANDRGEWTLMDLPVGTRMLEVRAVGYYPERRAVNVVAGARPIRVELSTLRAVLDTVKIVAARVRGRDIRGFLERSRGGVGHYMTEEDIARRKPLVTSDLFRIFPGLRVERTPLGDVSLTMRGMFADSCVPAIYLDGHRLRNLSADDLDGWVHPKEIAGIEVYTGAGVPPQFYESMTGCGSIVIWTK